MERSTKCRQIHFHATFSWPSSTSWYLKLPYNVITTRTFEPLIVQDLQRLKKFRSEIIDPFLCPCPCPNSIFHVFVKRLLRKSEISKSYETICDFRSRNGNKHINMSQKNCFSHLAGIVQVSPQYKNQYVKKE